MSNRDYIAEMRAIIDAETAGGPYAAPVVAERIVEKLRATDPDLLAGWLDVQAVSFVREAIGHRDRSARSHARANAGRSVFQKDAEKHEAGDESALDRWRNVVHVVEGGTRKPLLDMVKPELLFAADAYEHRESENAMQKVFLRALAKKVGKGKVADHFTPEQLDNMWRSIGGAP